MNAGKIASFVVTALVSASLAGCAATTTSATSPGYTTVGGGGAILQGDSAPPYKPAEIRESARGYGYADHGVAHVATRVLHHN